MKMNKKLTAFLSVLLILCMMASYTVFATETDEQVPDEENVVSTETADAATEEEAVEDSEEAAEEVDKDEVNYLRKEYDFDSSAEKLATMELMLEANGSKLYVDRVSGEVGFVDSATGQVLLSNPYDVAGATGSENTKNQLMSQIIIKYEDNGTEKTLDSYSSAAKLGQVNVKKTKDGVRVEYILGEMITRRLIPQIIEKTSFEENILNNMPKEVRDLFTIAYYPLKDPSDESLSDRQIREMQNTWPITREMAVYVFDPNAKTKDFNKIEGYIKQYAPSYTFEMLDADHERTGYEGTDKSPPLFRMALEYSIDENGNLDVRLPANGIRFDETVYTLTNIQILPYFGAGTTKRDGEILIPDGSGAIIRPAQFGNKSVTITNKIYGQDYAYQKVSGAHLEVMHMPVYGVVCNDSADNSSVGFLAVINEGDSLATITAENGGNLHQYFSAYTSFAPRPKDSYNLSESISAGDTNAVHTVVSERKYTGSYRIKYIMLNDEAVAETAGVDTVYEASYVGMAKAYRDYLVGTGELEPISEDSVNEDIPLFIESFGAVETTKRVASIPVTVLSPLTTFEDLKTMTERLAESDITNVNYKLTGFANGGMISTVPYKVKFDDAVGGNDGFEEFITYAGEKGINVFPDFDFVYFKKSGNFDGISNKALVKTMDNRYSLKQVYDSTTQSFEKTTEYAISPKAFDDLYEGFNENYSKLSPSGISVATLGSDLNSDFNKKEPYNREDSKQLTRELLESISTDYQNVLSDSANAYSLGYVDYYLNVPLDSSNYLNTSESVPFMGMVLHGYKTFAGSALNMAGDIDFQILKAIENGSSVYFILSYQNTKLLKESEELNKYYSVGFDIWYDDLVEAYGILNKNLADCQTSTIDNHEFILGERIPTSEEAKQDEIEAEEAAAAKEADDEARYQRELKRLKKEARQSGQNPDAVVLDKEEFLASTEIVIDKEETGEYVRTKYTTDDGKIAVVTYSNGVKFILNYNSFDVTVEYEGETYTLEGLGFKRIG